MAAIILAIVLIVGGAASYVAFNARTPSQSCTPSSSPVCLVGTNLHDVKIFVPLSSTQQGTPIPFTALLPSGEASSDISFNFGDGSYQNHTTSFTVDHAYRSPGSYIVSITAVVGGALHDSAHSLQPISVLTSYAADVAGIYPTEAGTVVSNATVSSGGTTLLHAGDGVTLKGSYTLAPTNPAYSLGSPQLVASGGVLPQAFVQTSTSAQAKFVFGSPGVYQVTFVGSGVSATAPLAYQNFTWTVMVAATGQNYGFAGTTTLKSPHSGTIIAYEDVPGGGQSMDPSIDYDVAAFEVLLNVYQALIAYNYTLTGPVPNDFVPLIATCVPGSAQCTSQWGNSLVSGGNYTFVISHAVRFYDPSTAASWGVYPSDVVFSLLRTMAFTDYPGVATTPGWIQSQALLPGGNGGWDGGLHSPFNNTPAHMFAAMTVNESGACPAAAMTGEHGCVTFHANAANSYGNAWPFFLELIEDPEGASVVPCGWYSAPAQGQGVPGWTLTNASNQGDHPCVMPTASQISALSPTAWDSWETGYINSNTGAYSGNTQWSTVGSGPYYLVSTQIHQSYTLKASPVYQQNPDCTWYGCEAPAGKYAPNIDVTWESSPTPGEQALASGVADIGYIPPTDTALLLQLSEQGKVNSLVVPTLASYFLSFDMNRSVSRQATYTSTPTNIPATWLTHLGVRQFLAHAYPYSAIQAQVNTREGIQYGFDIGGAIPQFMGNYYPSSINWPSGTPDTNPSDVGGAAWWWAQLTQSPSSPYYDSWTATHCTASTPCQFPIYDTLGSPDEDQRLTLFGQSVAAISHGAVKTSLVSISITQENLEELYSLPGTSALTMGTNDWYPDFPDPSDYMVPFYFPDSFFTFSFSTAEGIGSVWSSLGPSDSFVKMYNSTLPSGGACPTDYNYWVNNSVPQSCQGAAYDAMFGLLQHAGPLPPGPFPVLQYTQAENIANKLAILINEYQLNIIETFASWIDSPSLQTNVINAGDFIWWQTTGNDVQYPGST